MAFPKLFSKRQNKTPPPEAIAAQETPLVIDPSRRTVVYLYHGEDRDLWHTLVPHLRLLENRFPSAQVQWKQYLYSQYPVPKEEERHEQFLGHLQESLLFVPCTSAVFLTNFLSAMQKDSRMADAMGRTQVQPIALRAAHGVHQSILPQPFAAYSTGPEQDEAAVAIVARLEELLLSLLALSDRQEPSPLLLVEETKARQALLR